MEWREPSTGRIQQAMIRPGSVHVNPGDHPFYQRWEGHQRIMAIAFDRGLVEQVGASFGGKTDADIGTYIGARDAEVEAIAARLRRELVTGESAGRVLAESFAKALLVRLFRIYTHDRSGTLPVKGGLEAAKLARVLDYIDAHLSEKITLDRLAAVAGLSSHHFSGAFKAMTGLPPIKFVNRRRLERARDALATTDRTISDIAHGLGFPSHSHLSTYFKRDMGTPPSQFRSDWRHGSELRTHSASRS
ncbi:transcriptional regulator, AraC family [Brevundimonas abyssalis TAR-001]|uniref:Transcriptional regulator, AraC family n=2 Tax=Caulobacteraceae TaxID=76892 RepID=A0A8E0KJI8_9CAUL|nr:transcriptional regulator, AraC family [Brevundimonas abyssalis TAR-001]